MIIFFFLLLLEVVKIWWFLSNRRRRRREEPRRVFLNFVLNFATARFVVVVLIAEIILSMNFNSFGCYQCVFFLIQNFPRWFSQLKFFFFVLFLKWDKIENDGKIDDLICRMCLCVCVEGGIMAADFLLSKQWNEDEVDFASLILDRVRIWTWSLYQNIFYYYYYHHQQQHHQHHHHRHYYHYHHYDVFFLCLSTTLFFSFRYHWILVFFLSIFFFS